MLTVIVPLDTPAVIQCACQRVPMIKNAPLTNVAYKETVCSPAVWIMIASLDTFASTTDAFLVATKTLIVVLVKRVEIIDAKIHVMTKTRVDQMHCVPLQTRE